MPFNQQDNSTPMTQMLKKFVRPFAMVAVASGLDPRKLGALLDYPRYRSQRSEFKRLGGNITHELPILGEHNKSAGSGRGAYFHQDLLVASLVHQHAPERHLDIGSRIDGFVAHVASFRPIDVMDVRALEDTGHANIRFFKADLMDPKSATECISDSVSCLHAIEHFGLGRYGDPLDPEGHIKGFRNIVRMLKPGGRLYISFPIGRRNEVHFNAHRVFHPRDIFTWLDQPATITLERFDYVDDRGDLHTHVDIAHSEICVNHGCGIYTFTKSS